MEDNKQKMAAVDTMYSNGEDGDNVTINTIEWLKANKLSKLINYVEENEMTIEDFQDYDEEDMELRLCYIHCSSLHSIIIVAICQTIISAVLKDCNITAHAYKKKFKNAIRKLQSKSSNNKANEGTSPALQNEEEKTAQKEPS